MLPKALRLPASRVKRGQKAQTPFFIAFLDKNGTEGNRFLFIVSKNVAKTSVLRHRISRLLGEVAKKIPPKGLDVTIVALPGIQELDFNRLTVEFKKVLI